MITSLRSAVSAVAVAAIVGCGSSQPSVGAETGSDAVAPAPDTIPRADAGQDAPEDVAGALPRSCDDLHYEILKVPPTRQALSAEFGQPDSLARSVEPNRHVPGAVDSLFTVHYPGLLVDIRTPTGARDMATHVRVEENRYLAYPGIGIGTAAARLREVLGEPHEQGAGYLRYQCSEEVEQPVTFMIADDRVHAIEIAYYVD